MASRNRMAELQNVAAANGNQLPPSGQVNETALNIEDESDKFLQDIENNKAKVDEIVGKINDLNFKHNAIINPTADTDENELRKEVDEANIQIQSLASKTNTALKKMKLKLDATKNEIDASGGLDSSGGISKAMLRAHQSHYNVLTRRFKSVMEDYSKAQLNYREKLKHRLKKQLQIVDENRQFNDDEIDQMIETGNMQVFDDGFLKMQQNKQILDELEMRKNEMLNLEKSITELHALFVEMVNLVDEQGEMVNRILDNVANTEAYVEKAVEDVHQAARYQSGARRKKLWLVILCLIVLAVVALIIFLSIPKGS